MKTNNVLTRPMGDLSVNQRTKDGYFNATTLINQYNRLNDSNKEIKDYLENKSTQEFLSALVAEENLHGENSPYVTSKARADRGGGTWMHPIMFIDFAMWLNPSFKVKVIRFVSDELILLRDQAGDNYKKLSAAVSTIIDKNKMQDVMQRLSKSMNIIVFGTHETEIRNKRGIVASMRELAQLENTLAEFISAGFIKSEQGIRTQLNRIFDEKYPDYKLEH